MSFAKVLKTSLAIAKLSLLIGFNSFFTSDTLAEPVSNNSEIQEFKQLIDRTHKAWNSHNPLTHRDNLARSLLLKEAIAFF